MYMWVSLYHRNGTGALCVKRPQIRTKTKKNKCWIWHCVLLHSTAENINITELKLFSCIFLSFSHKNVSKLVETHGLVKIYKFTEGIKVYIIILIIISFEMAEKGRSHLSFLIDWRFAYKLGCTTTYVTSGKESYILLK